MLEMIKKVFTSILIVFFCASIALAAEQKQTRKKNQVGEQKRVRSCDVIHSDLTEHQMIVKQNRHMKRTPNGDQDRLRDGSCLKG